MTATRSPAPPQLPAAGGVYLTFDDGPDPGFTPRILDALAEVRLTATFFVVGQLACRQAALLRRIAEQGHEVGNHTWSHRHPWTLSETAARREVRDATAAIADILGRSPVHFRPPHGRVRRVMVEEARAHGQSLVLWHLSAVDWGPFGRARGIARRLRRARPGDIVLMHDGGWGINHPAELLQVLPAFLPRLATQAGPRV